MIPNSLYIINKFRRNIFLKCIRQLIHRAGKHKVLPDEKTQLITGIKEIILRIVAAAPDTDQIKIRRRAVLKQFPCPLFGNPAKNIVLRDIVRAHRKDRDAVYLMCKTLPVLVFLPAHPDAAQTDFLCCPVYFRTVLSKHHLKQIQVLLPVSPRPPESRVLHLNFRRGIRMRTYRTVRRMQNNIKGIILFLARNTAKIYFRAQRHPAVFVFLADIKIRYSGILYKQKRYRAVDSCIRYSWTPVPSKHGMRFS